VRAPSTAVGRERIVANLRGYGLAAEHITERLDAIPGDLEAPQLGLAATAYQELASSLDGIVQCGAAVNWTYPYDALAAANVAGTREILRLACAGGATPVHHMSTVGVFSSAYYAADRVEETEPLERSGPLAVGYAQTKWVAEAMVRAAGARGLPVTIHRLNTGGHSGTGSFNPRDHVCLALKGCLQLGAAPDSALPVQLAPIDFVSRAVAAAVLQPDLAGHVPPREPARDHVDRAL
jgi:thioester reductase-like protein